MISNFLSGLKIKCDYSHRGCQEYIHLEELDSHVENCGFAPVKCSNEECEMIVNKREIIHHESTVCEYRKVKCHNCVKIEQDVEELNEKMAEKMQGLDEKMEEVKDKMEEKMEEVKEKIEEMDEKLTGIEMKMEEKMGRKAADVEDLKRLMMQMFEKLRFLETTIQISSAFNYTSDAFVEDILVPGGRDSDGNWCKSVEKFSWKKNIWERVSSINADRVSATSFVYENQVFVLGGCFSPAIEVLNLNEDPLQWEISKAKLPFDCICLRSIVYQNRAVLFCACGKSDYCTELCLTAPYTCKKLSEMPEPPRKFYTVVAFEHKILIFGGKNVKDNHRLQDVLEFDLTTREFKDLPSLPGVVSSMAGVRWGDQAVLIGGYNDHGPSKKVLMYDSTTGTTTELPSMLEKREACAAVITGNTIVVMGGGGGGGGESLVVLDLLKLSLWVVILGDTFLP